ncbi:MULTISPECIES: NUDIX domain-containing protein [unclassified Streptomyces]|uniref:NUDIX domain-containing protein n=1 Tax=unclassified Streptomyces TaxID=2593676 RepID=UPI000BAC6F15|nr:MULTISPECIES: NUDIX domain-containing protein [unclassified Streptomyces]ASY33588.1 NUDIX hydrolase [Streptomyces sp. CLI2509]MYX23565.1 NUDIX domain-containing protein [Streptomyces sp. SID8380]
MHSENTPTEESAPARGAVAIITNRRGELLLHLRDDLPEIAWPAHWSVLGGGCDPGESPADAIVRELDEEAGLTVENLTELFEITDQRGSGQIITFFSGSWDGDETDLLLAEGVKLQFFAPDYLDILTIPPFIRDGIYRCLAARPS